MSIGFNSYHLSGKLSDTLEAQQQELLTGVKGGTIVKSLQLITGNESCYAWIIRVNQNGQEYANIKVDLKSNDYLVLWQGFFVIPYNQKIYFKSDSTLCKVVASVVEMNNE